MKIAVTGANGLVGRALLSNIDTNRFQATPLDLPEHDTADFEDLAHTTRGHDCLIHLAWNTKDDNFGKTTIDPVNNLMTLNVYKAAVANKIPRVIMASSNHAHRHDRPDTDGRIRASIEPPIPDSPYGAEKVFMEALGRFYATEHGLEVVCIRIGNVNVGDNPEHDRAEAPQLWLSHADLGRLVTCCLAAESVPDNFQIVYGVGRQELFDWSNPFGYEPQDGAHEKNR